MYTKQNISILVTGGAGFIGSHTSIELLENGYEVIIFDSLINSSRNVIDRIKKIVSIKNKELSTKLTFEKGDIRNENALNKVFENASLRNKPIEGVIHFAGLKSIEKSFDNTLNYWDVNLAGTISLLKVMQKNKCKLLIFSSSASIYSTQNKSPINEKDFISPISNYGRSKFAVEQLLEAFSNENGSDWSIAALRYFNPAGAHTSSLLGERPTVYTRNLFPMINEVGIGKVNELKIYGNDWDTFDGTCVRDYIHVLDVAKGHLKVLEFLHYKKIPFLTLNIGTGKGTSVLEIVNIFQEQNKVKINYSFQKRRRGDCDILFADNSKAISILNWRPKFSIKEMCVDSWNWQKKIKNEML